MRIAASILIAGLLMTGHAAAKPPQVLPDQMFSNLYALTQAASVMQICEDSSAWKTLPDRKKKVLKRLRGSIDDMVHKIARKFDNDVFGFYASERDKTAKDPDFIKHYGEQYGLCGDKMIDRMQWYVYDSRQKLDLFLSELPDAR